MPTPTFIEVAEQMVKAAETRVKLGENSPWLLRDYNDRLRRCRPFFGGVKVNKVDSAKVRGYRQWLADQGVGSSTILTHMSFVSGVVKLAHDDGHLSQRPTIPRKGHKDCPRPAFSRDEYSKLLRGLKQIERGLPVIKVKGEHVGVELRRFVTFQTNAFLRPGDLFELRHRHIDEVEDGGIRYLRLRLPASKGHAAPIITMPAAAMIYGRIKAEHPPASPDDFVFLPGRSNRQYAKEVVRRQFTAVLTHLGLKTNEHGGVRTLYSLRHTAIVFRLLNAKDLDLLTLARNCRTSVEMIDRFYASTLTAEMNRDRLHSFRRPTRYLA